MNKLPNQSRCKNDVTPRPCAVIGLETKYYIRIKSLAKPGTIFFLIVAKTTV